MHERICPMVHLEDGICDDDDGSPEDVRQCQNVNLLQALVHRRQLRLLLRLLALFEIQRAAAKGHAQTRPPPEARNVMQISS